MLRLYFFKWCYIFVFFQCICGLLDFDELKSVDYGLNLLETPVVKGTEPLSGAIFMTSKHGQQYQCSFPEISEQKKKEKEDEQAAVETGISELLRPMQDGPCLIYNKGWWTYEFCYGKQVKQYHMEEQKVQGDIISLGVYASEFDWNNATEKKKTSLNRFHSQQYLNGSTCDLTGKQRKTEIRFMCEEGAGDHISRIDEPETCGYIITVQTTKICHHPYLKPQTKSKPVPITCNPILSQAEYDEYQAEMEAEKKAKEEAVVKYRENMQKEADELKRLQEQKAKDNEKNEQKTEEESPSPDSSDLSTHAGVNKAMEQLQNLLSDTLAKGLQEAVDEYGLGDEFNNMDNVEMTMRYVQDPADLRRVMNEMLTEQKKKIANKKAQEEGGDDSEATSEGDSTADNTDRKGSMSDNTKDTAEIDTTEESNIESTADENVNDESNVKIKKYVLEDSDDKKSAYFEAQKDGDDVKEEEDDEEDWNDEEDDGTFVESEDDEDQEAVDDFEKGLDKIAPTEGAKERLAKYKENINSVMQAQFSDIVEEAQRELANEGENVNVDKKETFQKLSDTLAKLLGKLDKSGKVKSEQLEEVNKDTPEDNAKSPLPGEGDSEENIEPQSPLEPPEEEGKVKMPGSKIQERKDKLQNTVKESLENSFNKDGRKVEVRIVTAVIDENDKVHLFSEDSSSKVMFALLGDNDEDMREQQRQQHMEQAYNFKWSSKRAAGEVGQDVGQDNTVMQGQGEGLVDTSGSEHLEESQEVVGEEVEP